MENALIIFVRNPEAGKVKTRLAATTGNEEALRIYRFLLEKTRQTALQTNARRLLFYADFIPDQDEWPPIQFEKHLQCPGDLGARMREAFETTFDSGAEKALIIGSDCPDIDGKLLEQAFSALDESDFVLGPSLDGGYYLLGMKTAAAWLFDDMIWSTETVRAITLKRIASRGMTCAVLPELNDIDTEADWRSYSGRSRHNL